MNTENPENWFYSPEMVVGGDVERHTGLYIATGIWGAVDGYNGQVKVVKTTKDGGVYHANAHSGLSLNGLAISLGDTLRFRFERNGEDIRGRVSELQKIVCNSG